MELTCNIDERGVRARRIWGVLCVLAGIVMVGVALLVGTWWLWIVAGVMMAAGAFAFYESKKKWCAMRAMGIKTPV